MYSGLTPMGSRPAMYVSAAASYSTKENTPSSSLHMLFIPSLLLPYF
jgi:hypothetical protein